MHPFLTQLASLALALALALAAVKGHGQGQRYLAIFLVNGHGCDVDYERGRQWFNACEKGGDFRVEELCRVEGEQIEQLLETARERERELTEMYGEL